MWISFKNFIHIFFPPLCVCCNERLYEKEEYICIDCLLNLPLCYEEFKEISSLDQKLVGLFPYEQAKFWAYYEKDNSLQKIIHQIKYHKNKDLASIIGALAAKHYLNSNFFDNIDYLVPIPLHPKRLKSRTFNQAEKICEGISSVTSIPLLNTAFQRTKNNVSQTKFAKQERSENVKNIFRCIDHSQLQNKHILIVDDVITTGATIQSLVSAIPADLNVKVSVFGVGNAYRI